MANTFDLIQTFDAAVGGSAYADFTSIPSTFTDLRFIISSRNTDVYNEIHFKINNGGSYAFMYFQITGSTKSQSYSTNSSTIQGMPQAVSGATANMFGAGNLYVPYYQNSNMKKSVVGLGTQANLNTFLVGFMQGANGDTTNITSIRAQSSIGNLAEGTKISLYGIKNA